MRDVEHRELIVGYGLGLGFVPTWRLEPERGVRCRFHINVSRASDSWFGCLLFCLLRRVSKRNKFSRFSHEEDVRRCRRPRTTCTDYGVSRIYIHIGNPGMYPGCPLNTTERIRPDVDDGGGFDAFATIGRSFVKPLQFSQRERFFFLCLGFAA